VGGGGGGGGGGGSGSKGMGRLKAAGCLSKVTATSTDKYAGILFFAIINCN